MWFCDFYWLKVVVYLWVMDELIFFNGFWELFFIMLEVLSRRLLGVCLVCGKNYD